MEESLWTTLQSLSLPLLPLFITMLLGSSLFIYLSSTLHQRPNNLRQKLTHQGINGPKPSFFYGNIPDIKNIQVETEMKSNKSEDQSDFGARFVGDYAEKIFPYLIQWRKTYGPLFIFSTGSTQIVHATDPDFIKSVSHCTAFELGRPDYVRKIRNPLFGEGILMANGELWAHERKIISPEFFMHKIKGMINLINESANPLIEEWEKILEKNGGNKEEIMVDNYLRNFSGNVISRASFGDSYGKGEEIFSKLRELQKALSKSHLFTIIPLNRYLPSKTNREIKRLDREIRSILNNIVQERKKSQSSHRKDLLDSIIQGAGSVPHGAISAEDFIVDNCKNMYFAGFETTSVTATWCLLLLASNKEWQEIVRKEVFEVLNGAALDADNIRHLKMLTMVIQETLRLYPPASLILREALHDINLQKIHIPKGTIIQITVSMLHRDADVWGPDADEFNPNRFEKGISTACKYPHMYIPFGLGPRTCAGQNLAMVELKTLLANLLGKFSFEISENYVHSPAYRLTIEPEHGLPLVVKRL
ncbi:hypothetical protein LUZ60_015438 [Juncus effusus]|nr:hypothetical protein LUZ60_015438 [Juncus effusus]